MSLARDITRARGGDWAGTEGLIPGPGHSAKDRSMSVRDNGAGDDVLLHSFVGDDWKPVKDALRLEGLLPERTSPRTQGVAVMAIPSTGGPYVYRDADGRPVLRVVRKAGSKGFYQQHAVPGGEWITGLNGTDPLPYRLPELVAAHPEALVYICEGEKDADNLAALGEVTTTNPGGAGKWPDSFASHLQGRQCIALADNDEPGRAHAADVAVKLARAGVDCVTLELPGLAPKGDVSDWIAAGGTTVQLAALTYVALNAPPPAFATDLPVIDPTAWQGQPVPPREWLIDGWLARGTGALLTGTGGVGKSLLAQQVATCFATGAAFMGVPVAPAVALYITCEDGPDELQRRQENLNAALGCNMSNLARLRLVSLLGELDNQLLIFAPDGTARRGPLFDKIEALALHLGATFVALDHVAHLFGGNENDRHQVTAFLNLLNAFALRIGGTVMVLGHENKAGASYSGSTAWQGGVRQHWHLDYPEDDGSNPDPDARILSRPKANYSQRGNDIGFAWERGAFVQRDAAAVPIASDASGRDNAIFLACLKAATEQRRAVSHSPNAGTYAPKTFARMPEAKRLKATALAAAMERLFALGEIAADQRLWQRDNRGWVLGISRAESAPRSVCTPVHVGHSQVIDIACTPVHPAECVYTTYIPGADLGVSAPDPRGEDEAQPDASDVWNRSLLAARTTS